jgi:quinol monooxygenase YgiN
MIIVSGWLQVEPQQIQAYLDSCRPIIEAARAAPGCIGFYLSADPLELAARIAEIRG